MGGMLLYQWTASGLSSSYKLPFGHKASVHAWRKEAKIEKICEQALRPTMPSLAPPSFVKVAYRCWESDPSARGTFAEIVETLNADSGLENPVATFRIEPERATLLREPPQLKSRTLAALDSGVALCPAMVRGRYLWTSTSAPSIVVFDVEDSMRKVCVLAVSVVITSMCAVEVLFLSP